MSARVCVHSCSCMWRKPVRIILTGLLNRPIIKNCLVFSRIYNIVILHRMRLDSFYFFLDCCYTTVFFPFLAENDSHWKVTYNTSFIDDIFANIWQIFQKIGPSALPDGDLAKQKDPFSEIFARYWQICC